MGGSLSSNMPSAIFEINDVITKHETHKNSFEIGLHGADIKGCMLDKDTAPYSGGEHIINLPGVVVDDDLKCSDKIYDNEKYFSTCFLVPKDLKIKENDGTDVSDTCKLIYKTEIQCEGDDIEEDDIEEDVEESFTNLKNNDSLNYIFIGAIILALFIIIKRKN
tara:strand:- start:929 stop:1420 length:492 start_codon:yes stop_codon:yes gene_type:complete